MTQEYLAMSITTAFLDADVPVAAQIPRSESALDYFASNWLQFPLSGR